MPSILREEVRNAIERMKMTADILRLRGEDTIEILTKLFNKIMEMEEIPNQWNEAKVIILHKKGNMKDIKNYRPISLLPHLYKIFTRVILARVA